MEISPSTLTCLILRFLCTSNLPLCEKQESYNNFQLLGNISECQLIPLHKNFHASTVFNQENLEFIISNNKGSVNKIPSKLYLWGIFISIFLWCFHDKRLKVWFHIAKNKTKVLYIVSIKIAISLYKHILRSRSLSSVMSDSLRPHQAGILEWVAISFFRASSWRRDLTHIFCIACIGRWILYYWATWEAP